MPDISLALHNPFIAQIFKYGMLLLLGLFALFLLVILKQIRSMNTIITQPDLFPILQAIMLGLLALNVFIFVLGLVIL